MTKFAVRALLLVAALLAVSLRPSDVTIAAAFEGGESVPDSRSSRSAALEALETWERNGSVPTSAVHGSESIIVHNPKSSPVVGGTWEIAALIEGSGDFRVSATAPTTIGAPGQDTAQGVDVTLDRIRVEGQPVEANWDGREWVVPGISGSLQVNITLRVHSLGRHRVGLTFGSALAYADNSALPTFTPIASGTTGLDTNSGHTMVFADFNGDGWPDMAKSDDGGGGGDPIRVLLNNQNGTFTLSATVSNSSQGLGYGDWDHDGDMDKIFSRNSGNAEADVLTSDGTGTSWAATNIANNRQIEATMFADIDSDGDLDVWAPGSDLWYRNNFDGTWTAQTTMPGGVGSTNNGEGASVADMNNDGRPDYIWNRDGSVCYAFLSSGANNFTQDTNVNAAGGISGLPQDVGNHENMEWAWCDYDNDADMDVFISGDAGVGLYQNNGSGAFTDVSVAAGVSITSTTTGAAWADYDNDGDWDLLVAKGTNTVLYKNSGSTGSFAFTNATLAAGLKDITGPVGFCDFDLDGDMDVMSLTGQYFRNELSGNAKLDFLRVEPLGAGGTGWSPRTPIGARVQLWNSTGTTLLSTQWVGCHQNNFQSWNFVQFGCDRDTEYQVKVRYPSTLIEITVTGVVPSLVSTGIGSTNLTQTIAVYENAQPSYTAFSGNPWGTMILYGESSGSSILRQRSYDSLTNSMGPEATTLQLGRELRWLVRPTQNTNRDIITILQEHDNGASRSYFRCLRFNGQIWQVDWTDGGTAAFTSRLSQIRSIDMVAEKTSGDILVVYSDGDTNPMFRTYTGGAWSAPAAVFATTPITGTVEWVRLAARPGSNECWLACSDTNEILYTMRWNGASWDEAATEFSWANTLKRNTSTANCELQAFDIAYEQLSGDLLVCYGPNAVADTTIRYRTKAAASDTFSGELGFRCWNIGADATSEARERANIVRLVPDPLTNRIAMGCMTTNSGSAGRTGAGMWSGTAWANTTTLAQTNLTHNDGATAQHLDMLDMTWLPALSQVIMPYQDDGTDDDIDWASWNRSPGGTANDWDDEPDVAAAGFREPRSVLSWTNLDETRIVSLVSNDISSLFIIRWDGSTWTIANSGAALETSISTITNGTPFTLYSPFTRTGTPGLWVGGIDSDWNNPANWHNWQVPSGIAVTINSGATNYPIISKAGGSVTNISVASGASLSLTTAGSLTVTGTVSLSGTMTIDAGSTLTMGNGASIAVASGASLFGRGSDSGTAAGAATITVANPATQSWTVTVATGGTVDLKGTAITAGRIIPQNNVTLRLSDVSFSTLPTATTNFIDMSLVQTGTINMRNLSFTRGSNVTAANARNILTTSTTFPIVVYGTSGDLGGESYDGDTTNRIHWQNNCLNLNITGTAFWTYEREIRIDRTKVGRGGLTNYPVYVTLTDPAMVSKAQADGDDFRFMSATGTKLDHEIETWDTTTGKLTAWIEIPALSDKVDTLIYLQYGNASATNQQNASGVWDANHMLVWHLDDAATGTATDSTTNARHGTSLGLTATTGTYGDAANWSSASTGRYVQRAVAAFHPATTVTHEAWVRINNGSARNIFSYATAGSDNAYRLEGQASLRPYINGTNPSATGLSVNDGNWHHVAMTWDSTDGIVRVYVDGIAQGAVTINMGASITTTGGLVLGQDQDSVLGGFDAATAWVGDMDEFRLSNIARSEAWLTTNYRNGSNPATFAVVGVEENRGPNLVDIYNFLPGVGETLNISSTLSDTSGNDHITHADHRGLLQLASFSGTINIDGLRFIPATTANGLSVAAGATGTINFYNCAFIDLGTTKTTTVAGDNRAVVSKSGTTTLNAFFCTIDSNNAATAGFTAATSCLFTSTLTTGAAGTRATYVVDYNNKNFRPTYAMLNDGAYSVARHGTYTRDQDGRVRSATTRIGAWEGATTSATVVGNSDITNGAGGGTIANRIIFNTIPANNTAGNAIYMTGSDGTNVYVTVLNRTTLTVAYVASFAGTAAGFVTFVQTSDQATQYWLYVSYDSDGNGTFDRVRRLKHTVNTSLTDAGNQSILNRLGGAIDFTSGGGWAGQFTLQNSFTTGVLSGEYQVGLATPASFGSVHAWYVDRASAGGAWWPTIALVVNNGWAADSYSGIVSFTASPNPYAQPFVTGSPSSGQVMLVRTVDATNTTSVLTLSRNTSGTSTVLNSYTGPTTIGESITGTPFSLFQAQSRQLVQRTDSPGPILLQWPTLTTDSATIPNHTGYGGVWGVPPVGFFSAQVNYLALREIDGCFGAVVAMEYKSDQNATAAFEPLNSTYSNANLRYDDDSGLPGGFDEGVARVIGNPTRLAYAPTPTTNAVIFCSTDAGLLYCWEAHPAPATSANANRKGQLISGFPIRIEGGRITSCNAVAISDTTLLSRLNLPAPVAPATTRNVLACFTDRGQIILVRIPETP